MKILIDFNKKILRNNKKDINIYSKKAFEIISDLWVKLGWNQKYSYNFSWLGRPIIQVPEDIVRLQEIIYNIKPTKIVETGIAHGGTTIFFASLLKFINNGKVIAVDINIKKKNLREIQKHFLRSTIKLIEGSSVDPKIFKKIKKNIKKNDKVFVFLDSNHTFEHVYQELVLYSEIVTKNSYMVVCDGIMKLVHDTPRAGLSLKEWQKKGWIMEKANLSWKNNNPLTAIKKFLRENDKYIIDEPKWLFNESKLNKRITYSPNCFLKKIK